MLWQTVNNLVDTKHQLHLSMLKFALNNVNIAHIVIFTLLSTKF